jgi:hypothetical protein
MDAIKHAEYLLSLVNEKGELRVEDDFRYRVAVHAVSESAEATEHFKRGVQEKTRLQ